MEKIERTIKYVALYNIYKEFVTHTQVEIMGDYFLADLSLSEIADSRNISRSAVEDAIKKGTIKLDECEEKLHLLAKREKMLELTAKMKKKALNYSELQELEKLEEEIKNGIWKPNRKTPKSV